MDKEQLRKNQFNVLISILKVKSAYKVLCDLTFNFALQEILAECEDDVNSLEETYNDVCLSSVEKERFITQSVNRIIDMIMEYERYANDNVNEDPSITRFPSTSYLIDYAMNLRLAMARCGYGQAFVEEEEEDENDED